MDGEIFVCMALNGEDVPVGRLWSRVRNGRESASFAYEAAWLENPRRFALEPALLLASGPFHTPPEKALFGALGDSAPDSWGRMLMRRAERQRAEREKETPRTLFEADFLLRVNDEARQGALRLRTEPEGEFLAPASRHPIPPLVALPRLLSASERIAGGDEDREDLRLLLAPGSSLGGARPKASVREADGQLALAKFPRRQDEVDAVLWEGVALSLADKAGIDVPEWSIKAVNGKPVIILRRFDRAADGRRIAFLSAMSMLGAQDHEAHCHAEIADALQQHGAASESDLKQLWRRMLFSVLVSNTDNHLRNHGFLCEGQKGWRLSPAYDMNPVPVDMRPRVLATSIVPDDATMSLELSLQEAGYYGLQPAEAESIAVEVGAAVAEWRNVAAGLGVHAGEINRMASAFEHEDLSEALRLGGK